MGRELKDGEQVLLRGSAGALFRVTVGQPFTRELIERRLKAGEWSWPGSASEPAKSEPAKDAPKAEPTPEPEPEDAAPEAEPTPDQPAHSAPKSEWVAYVARTQHMSREDAANYTKADLIDMAK